jgi:hypothetical protein
VLNPVVAMSGGHCTVKHALKDLLRKLEWIEEE